MYGYYIDKIPVLRTRQSSIELLASSPNGMTLMAVAAILLCKPSVELGTSTYLHCTMRGCTRSYGTINKYLSSSTRQSRGE